MLLRHLHTYVKAGFVKNMVAQEFSKWIIILYTPKKFKSKLFSVFSKKKNTYNPWIITSRFDGASLSFQKLALPPTHN